MAKVERVLVGANNFGTALLPGQIIRKGETVSVDQEIADNLDTHVWLDSANNEHPVFVKPTDRLAQKYVGEVEPTVTKKAVKKKATKKSTSRRATRKKSS